MEKDPLIKNTPEEFVQAQKIKTDKKKKVFLIFFAVLAILGIGIFYIFLNNKQTNNISTNVIEGKNVNLTPTPFPFMEMTIPYLRQKEYSSKLGERELVSNNSNYTSYLTSYISEGFKVNAQLTVPKGEEPAGGWPAIVFIHGYIPPSTYQTFGNYSDYVDYLARNGFVVLKIDLRGHGNSEGEAGGGYFSADYINDALNARAALASSGYVNPSKIGLWGHSMAGNVVLRSLAAKPEIPAIVIWAGAVYTYDDMQKYGIDDNSYRPPSDQSNSRRRRQELFDKYGEFSSTSEFWKKVPATNYLSDIKGAIQLNHAIDDDVVNIGYSRDLAKILGDNGKTYELNEYPSGGHNINGPSFNSAMQNTVNFFKKYL